MSRLSDLSSERAARFLTFVWDNKMYEIALSWSEITELRVLLLDSIMSLEARKIRRVGPYTVPHSANSFVTQDQLLDTRGASYYSEPVTNRIASDYKRGYTLAQVAFMYGLPIPSVELILRKNGIERRQVGYVGEAQAALIRRLLVEGAARKAAGLDPVTGEPLEMRAPVDDSVTEPE